jgi:hypothetical protein
MLAQPADRKRVIVYGLFLSFLVGFIYSLSESWGRRYYADWASIPAGCVYSGETSDSHRTYPDSIFVIRSAGIATVQRGVVTHVSPNELILATDSGPTLFERKIARRLAYDYDYHRNAAVHTLCVDSYFGPWLEADDSLQTRVWVARGPEGAAIRLSKAGYSIPGQPAAEEPALLATRRMDDSINGTYDKQDLLKLMLDLPEERSGIVRHLTTRDEGITNYVVDRYREADDSLTQQQRVVWRHWDVASLPEEVVSAIPGFGSMLGPLSTRAPTTTILLVVLTAVVLATRAIIRTYESLVLARAERELALFKLQLDIGNALAQRQAAAHSDPGSTHTSDATELWSRFNAIIEALHRRRASVARIVGRDAFWRWTRRRNASVEKKWEARAIKLRTRMGESAARVIVSVWVAFLTLNGVFAASFAAVGVGFLGLLLPEYVRLGMYPSDLMAVLILILLIVGASQATITVWHSARAIKRAAARGSEPRLFEGRPSSPSKRD